MFEKRTYVEAVKAASESAKEREESLFARVLSR